MLKHDNLRSLEMQTAAINALQEEGNAFEASAARNSLISDLFVKITSTSFADVNPQEEGGASEAAAARTSLISDLFVKGTSVSFTDAPRRKGGASEASAARNSLISDLFVKGTSVSASQTSPSGGRKCF